MVWRYGSGVPDWFLRKLAQMKSSLSQGAQHLAALPAELSFAVDLFGVSFNEDYL
jgi:hypothetical protein